MANKHGGHNLVDMTGQKHHRLLVIERSPVKSTKGAMWRCKCDCGATTTVTGIGLRNGSIKSCGCLDAETRARFAQRQREFLKDHRFGKTVGEPLDRQIAVQLSARQHQAIKAYADEQGLSLGTTARLLLLKSLAEREAK